MHCFTENGKLPQACMHHTFALMLTKQHCRAMQQVLLLVDTKRDELQANDGVRRVSALQKEVAHCKQELQSCQQATHQAANNMADLQVSHCSIHKPSCF
jgi:hypothetical protein